MRSTRDAKYPASGTRWRAPLDMSQVALAFLIGPVAAGMVGTFLLVIVAGWESLGWSSIAAGGAIALLLGAAGALPGFVAALAIGIPALVIALHRNRAWRKSMVLGLWLVAGSVMLALFGGATSPSQMAVYAMIGAIAGIAGGAVFWTVGRFGAAARAG